MKPLHSYNALRSSFLRGMALSHVPTPGGDIKGMRVVDVGCGGGILAECLCKMGLNVVAIDAAREAIPTPLTAAAALPARPGCTHHRIGEVLRPRVTATVAILYTARSHLTSRVGFQDEGVAHAPL